MPADEHLGAQFWHGTPSGDLRGGHYGLHVGSYEAARQALNARIGKPAEGEWDGTRIYGHTKLDRSWATGSTRNDLSDYPEPATYHEAIKRPGGGWDQGPAVAAEDRLPGKVYNSRGATYSSDDPVPMDAVPDIFPVRISGRMTNTPRTPHEDFKANGLMSGQIKRGRAKSGYFYTNIGEDEGSISAVVPGGAHVERLDRPKQMRFL